MQILQATEEQFFFAKGDKVPLCTLDLLNFFLPDPELIFLPDSSLPVSSFLAHVHCTLRQFTQCFH